MKPTFQAVCRIGGLWLALIAPLVARGATMLDQSNFTSPDSGGYFAHSTQSPAQTFTVGLTGKLAAVDVAVELALTGGSSPLRLEIWSLANAVTLDQKLDEASLPKSEFTTNSSFHHYALSGAVQVTSGEQLAIVLRSSGVYPTQAYAWPISPGTSYPGGDAFTVINSPSGKDLNLAHPYAGDPSTADFGFKTFVNVPEPGGPVLILMALTSLVLWRRRQRFART